MNQQIKNGYDTADQNLFTRFETGDQGDFLLAYSGLLFAHLTAAPSAGAEEETLTLIYVTHTVTVHGTRLSPLLLVIQKGRAESIREGSGLTGGQTNNPTVREIIVAEGAKESSHL